MKGMKGQQAQTGSVDKAIASVELDESSIVRGGQKKAADESNAETDEEMLNRLAAEAEGEE